MKYLLFVLLFSALPLMSAEESATHPYLKEAAKALVDADGKKVDQSRLLAPKYVLVYFSAHWCPPCRAFTPKLVKFYNEQGGGTKFELLFVSSDRDSAKMLGYMKDMTMPWIGLRFGSSKTADFKRTYGGDGIPCLTLIDENDKPVFTSYVDGEYVGPEVVLEQFSTLLKAK